MSFGNLIIPNLYCLLNFAVESLISTRICSSRFSTVVALGGREEGEGGGVRLQYVWYAIYYTCVVKCVRLHMLFEERPDYRTAGQTVQRSVAVLTTMSRVHFTQT